MPHGFNHLERNGFRKRNFIFEVCPFLQPFFDLLPSIIKERSHVFFNNVQVNLFKLGVIKCLFDFLFHFLLNLDIEFWV